MGPRSPLLHWLSVLPRGGCRRIARYRDNLKQWTLLDNVINLVVVLAFSEIGLRLAG